MIQPNAGQPRLEDGRAVYDMTGEAFAEGHDGGDRGGSGYCRRLLWHGPRAHPRPARPRRPRSEPTLTPACWVRRARACRIRSRREDQEALLLGVDDVLLAPAAHDPDARLDGRARHVREGQPRESVMGTNVPPRSGRPCSLGELEEQTGEARFNPSAAQFRDPAGEFHEALRQAGEQAPDERRILLEQRKERLPRDQEDRECPPARRRTQGYGRPS